VVEGAVGVCCLTSITALSNATGVSRPRSQLVVKILIAVILTSLCMYILRQYDSAGTVHVVCFPMCSIFLFLIVLATL
jgi:hypothetical protein